jgi:hypothetical protein
MSMPSVLPIALALALTPPLAGAPVVTGPFSSYLLDCPCRLLDTRTGVDGRIVDEDNHGWRVQENCGVPLGAAAVIVNVTVTGALGPGFLSLWAAGAPRPATSTLNFGAGQTVANGSTVRLRQLPTRPMPVYDLEGFAHVEGGGGIDMVIDVVGYLQ